MYHLQNSQLRVCNRYLKQERNKKHLKNTRLIILQHILSDTCELIKLFHGQGIEVHSVIAKPYSIDESSFSKLVDLKIPIYRQTYEQLETTDFIPNLLEDAITKSKSDGKKIVIQEVGGYFAKFLVNLKKEDVKFFAGVVEDTTFGHNRYQALISKFKIPVFSVARSSLKEIEAKFVGDSTVTALDQILRELGVTISGRKALVVGYGMIGKNVASALSARKLNVSVYDKHDHRNLRAFSRGYHIHKKRKLLSENDLIISATGTNALTIEDIEECKDLSILASAGSKDIEFDVVELENLSFEKNKISEHIDQYSLPNGKTIYLVKKGTAVNFLIKSVPDEIIDLVFSEIVLSTIILIKTPEDVAIGSINSLSDNYLNEIAKDWLKDINR
jgi:adenosylhomocysteinase